MKLEVKEIIGNHYDWIVDLRRYFHTYPEVSGQEYNTQAKIIAELKRLGLEPRAAGGTGVIAEIHGAKLGKTIAIRADIDALNLQDENEKSYRSVNNGACHACGHDGHAAMLLGVAKVLAEMSSQITGSIRLIFEPCEEAFPGGAERLIKEGVLESVDAIIGVHLWQPLEVGTVGISYGPMMASPDEFTITIQGRGGHGSMPHQALDSLLAGAQLVVGLNTIISRNIDPMDNSALSIGVFKAGDMPNIIPDRALIRGTVRTFDQNVRLSIFERIDQITEGICKAAGVSYEINKIFGFPPVINNPQLARVAAISAEETVTSQNVLEIKPVMAGEDFSLYQEKVPGVFIFIGAGNPAKGICYPHHHPKFDIDEKALANGVEVMVRTTLKLLGA